jgi:3-methyladenine DNA glycosylase Tag
MYRRAVGYKRVKTEHAGAKNGGGAWMTRAEAKESAGRKRRQADAVLRRMTEDEEAAGLSWETFRSN